MSYLQTNKKKSLSLKFITILSVVSAIIGIFVDFKPLKEMFFSPETVLIDPINDSFNDHSFRSIKELTIDDVILEYRNSKQNIQTYIENIKINDENFKEAGLECLNAVIEKEDNPQTKSIGFTLKGIHWFQEAKKQLNENKLEAKKTLEKTRETLEKALETYKSNKHAKYYLLKTYQMIQQFIINNASPEKDLPKKDLKYLQKLNSNIEQLNKSLLSSENYHFKGSDITDTENHRIRAVNYYGTLNILDNHLPGSKWEQKEVANKKYRKDDFGVGLYAADVSILTNIDFGKNNFTISFWMKTINEGFTTKTNHNGTYTFRNAPHAWGGPVDLIGINKYSGKLENLRFPVSDAIEKSEDCNRTDVNCYGSFSQLHMKKRIQQQHYYYRVKATDPHGNIVPPVVKTSTLSWVPNVNCYGSFSQLHMKKRILSIADTSNHRISLVDACHSGKLSLDTGYNHVSVLNCDVDDQGNLHGQENDKQHQEYHFEGWHLMGAIDTICEPNIDFDNSINEIGITKPISCVIDNKDDLEAKGVNEPYVCDGEWHHASLGYIEEGAIWTRSFTTKEIGTIARYSEKPGNKYYYWVVAKNELEAPPPPPEYSGIIDSEKIEAPGGVSPYEWFNSAEVAKTNINNKRILSIGIDKYHGKFEKLNFAVSDAIKISEAFNKYGYKSSTLTNDAAVKSNFLDELFHEVLISKPDDTFVLYIAGHGFSDINGNLFVVPYSDGKRYPIISLSEINSLLSFHKGKTYALIDTCFDRKEVDLDSYVQGLPVSINDNQTTFILASDTKAIESNSFKSGLMTYSILNFLESYTIDFDNGWHHLIGAINDRCVPKDDDIEAIKKNYGYQKIDFQKMFSYISRNTKKLALSKFQYDQSPKFIGVRFGDVSGEWNME